MKKIMNQDIVCSIIFLMVGAFFYKGSIAIGKDSWSAGAEYFPKMISSGIMILSLIYLVKSFRKKEVINYFKCENRENKLAFFKVIGIVIIFLILWPYVPFMLLSSVYLIILGFVFKAKFKNSLIFSISASVIIYMVFSKIFHVMLS